MESRDVDESNESEDSNESDDDEEAKMLSQQIVESTRRGSPAVVMHARKMLLAMNEWPSHLPVGCGKTFLLAV